MKFLFLLLPLFLFAQPTELARELIKQHEGFSSKVYKDRNGYAIGYGTNLNYITKTEANYLLNSRLNRVDVQLRTLYPWYLKLPLIPRSIVLDMTYNMGIDSFSAFRKMHYQLAQHNWVKAAIEMRASLWFKQTGTRSLYLYNLMRNHK